MTDLSQLRCTLQHYDMRSHNPSKAVFRSHRLSQRFPAALDVETALAAGHNVFALDLTLYLLPLIRRETVRVSLTTLAIANWRLAQSRGSAQQLVSDYTENPFPLPREVVPDAYALAHLAENADFAHHIRRQISTDDRTPHTAYGVYQEVACWIAVEELPRALDVATAAARNVDRLDFRAFAAVLLQSRGRSTWRDLIREVTSNSEANPPQFVRDALFVCAVEQPNLAQAEASVMQLVGWMNQSNHSLTIDNWNSVLALAVRRGNPAVVARVLETISNAGLSRNTDTLRLLLADAVLQGNLLSAMSFAMTIHQLEGRVRFNEMDLLERAYAATATNPASSPDRETFYNQLQSLAKASGYQLASSRQPSAVSESSGKPRDTASLNRDAELARAGWYSLFQAEGNARSRGATIHAPSSALA
ncbi:hypothetical protein CAOG_04085 [Capsaspora owczarzaki ATCC 30864]|uniref:hypothetical protein n=1 Tax=Capsaspora owczarzaki (strain ATCC 30864) TaxID=595528 RepID=UPI0001FE4F1D|nr:hypothetical protein CAOG_04085 [Capsaspora owczarzaki ATCC 30864]|eukprot:XP_004347910.1 hypothetical protein CAOG_04085 [Capsaspora owczarzaki ATCC 30864]